MAIYWHLQNLFENAWSKSHLDIHWESVEAHGADEGDPENADFDLAVPDQNCEPGPDQNKSVLIEHGDSYLADPDQNCDDLKKQKLYRWTHSKVI